MPAKKDEIIVDSKNYFMQVRATVEKLSDDNKTKIQYEIDKKDLEIQLMKSIGLPTNLFSISDQINTINRCIIELNGRTNDALKFLEALNLEFDKKVKNFQ